VKFYSFLTLCFFYSNLVLGDISYLSNLTKYGCLDKQNPESFFKSDILTPEQKKFILDNIPSKVLQQGAGAIEHETDSRSRRRDIEGNRAITKSVILRRCKAEVEILPETYNPEKYIMFAPTSISPDCLNDQGIKDPSCEAWKKSILGFIENSSNENPNFPLDITFQGHSNSISDETLLNMMGTPKHCESGGIFKTLDLCDQRLEPKCRQDIISEVDPASYCFKRLSKFKSKYLELLSLRRADEMRKKFEELFRKSSELRIVSDRQRDQRIEELKGYIEIGLKESKEYARLQSKLLELGITDNLKDLLDECYEFSLGGESQIDNCFLSQKKSLVI